jgi:hypothetical protein
MDDLTDIASELVTYLNFFIGATKRSTSPQEIAPAADSVCAYYQGVGICELLLDAEVDTFFHHMIRSGRSRRWLLQKARGQATYQHKVLKASNTRGFFGALVANDWTLAAEIAELSARGWNERIEYEDDFFYAHFLHRFVVGDDKDALRGILAEYARALDGDEPASFRLCNGLCTADEEQSLAAFADLIDDRRKKLDQMRQTSLLATDDLFVPFSSVYVEGLAWLRLLERAGVHTLVDYMFCPALARAQTYAPYTPNGFPD